MKFSILCIQASLREHNAWPCRKPPISLVENFARENAFWWGDSESLDLARVHGCIRKRWFAVVLGRQLSRRTSTLVSTFGSSAVIELDGFVRDRQGLCRQRHPRLIESPAQQVAFCDDSLDQGKTLVFCLWLKVTMSVAFRSRVAWSLFNNKRSISS